MRWYRAFMLCVLAAVACLQATAANLRITNLQADRTGTISLDIAWDHAWNLPTTPANHDAVWLFLKYRIASGPWIPLLLSDSTTLSPSTTLQTETVTDHLGLFLLPPPNFSGHIPTTRLTLQATTPFPAGALEIRAYAIEMVHIPQSPFWLGDATSYNTFSGPSGQPYLLTSEAEIPQGALADTTQYPPAAPIPAPWPKGFQAFYCMKYELSQAQYTDFLNTLTYTQQQQRTAIAPNAASGTPALTTGPTHRNAIRILQPGTSPSQPATYTPQDGAHRACNFLTWADLCAYLDWAGLRPLTEFEYEKACRGPLTPIPAEFAWGTPLSRDANTIIQDGTPTETSTQRGDTTTGLASHGYDGPQGPLRCGFAADPATGRVASGSAYYGCMEMSGNLWEQCVTVNTQGLLFQAITGDGKLSIQGHADTPTWPTAAGAGFRGGGWNSGIIPGFRDLATSDRFYAGLPSDFRRNTSGGRGGR